MLKYTHVIWDWNGTLLNDVDWCLAVINIMLAKRNLPTLKNIDAYHSVFGFPIIEYYRRAGFNFEEESFEALAVEYMDLYHSNNRQFGLFPSAETMLSSIQKRGLHQIILSASERNYLKMQMEPYNIKQYFDEILGISDIYGESKVGLGRSYIEKADIGRAVLIGDTSHDCEVADALGADCILIASGHQSKAVLRSCGVQVVDDIKNILDIIAE